MNLPARPATPIRWIFQPACVVGFGDRAGGQGQRAFDNLLFGGFERESVDFEKECSRQEAGAFVSI